MTWWERFFNKKEKTHEEICRETSPELIKKIEDLEEFWHNPRSPVDWWQRTWFSPQRYHDHRELWEVYYMDLESKTWKYQIIDARTFKDHANSNKLDPKLIGGGEWLVHESQIGKKQ